MESSSEDEDDFSVQDNDTELILSSSDCPDAENID